MANRFGRQQKRKMRAEILCLQAEISRLQKAYTMADGLCKRQGEKISDLEDEIYDAKQMVGSNSALFRPTLINVSFKEREAVDVVVSEPFTIKYEPSLELSSFTEQELSTTRLDVLLSNTGLDYKTFGYHAIVNFGGKRWAYGVDEQAKWSLSKERLIEKMSMTLALQIASDIQKDKEKHRG